MPRTLSFLLVCFLCSGLIADVRLPAILGDAMVLQRDRRVPIWGWSEPGKTITVRFAGQAKTAIVGADGAWRVDLDPMPASADGRALVVDDGANPIELRDVLVGEVWLCSGQSNMQFGLARSQDGESVAAQARHPQIRLFNVANQIHEPPGGDVRGNWARCMPGSVARFSAVGYYFGRTLHERLGVPVGLINSSWGATPGEAWTPVQALAAVEPLRPILEPPAHRVAAMERMQQQYQRQLAEHEAAVAKAKAAGKPLPQPPRMPPPLRPESQPGACYESMIAPLIPFAIRGAVWYQGESNLGNGALYAVLMPALIKAWRDRWNQGDFPVGVVQLPNNRPVTTQPVDSQWARVREAQLQTAQALADVGLAVTIDVGDANDGHPKNKKPVGERLALWALSDVYGKPVGSSGPVIESQLLQGDRIVLTFTNAGTGLRSRDGSPLRGFAVAGADRQWRWAEATIAGKDQVVVRSREVPEPVAVRYAWADNPGDVNLTNDRGLPASPFRTDDWPYVAPPSP